MLIWCTRQLLVNAAVLNIFVESHDAFFFQDYLINKIQKNSIYSKYFFKIINATVTFDKFNASLWNKWDYIYIYAFSRRFYPKRLTVHSRYTYFCQYMCSLGIEPTTFALLMQCSNHWATGTRLLTINFFQKRKIVWHFSLLWKWIKNTDGPSFMQEN